MNTYIIPEDRIEDYRTQVLSNEISCVEECTIKTDLLGYEQIDFEEAKQKAKVGDCLLLKYENILVPWQIIHKYYKDDGTTDRCVLQPYYLLEKRAFDQNTNVWRDSELRKYLNSEFLDKLDPEFVKMLRPTEVHTDNYTTIDRVWIPSHEEIGYHDSNGMFKKNIGAKAYDYYKSTAS